MKYIVHKLGPFGRMGHQAKEMMSAYLLSELYGLKYLHYPFSNECEHWESQLNLGSNQASLRTVSQNLGIEQDIFPKTANPFFRKLSTKLLQNRWKPVRPISDGTLLFKTAHRNDVNIIAIKGSKH